MRGRGIDTPRLHNTFFPSRSVICSSLNFPLGCWGKSTKEKEEEGGVPLGQKLLSASSGNRTRAARVAGEHSTTEPTMLLSGQTPRTLLSTATLSHKMKIFAVGRIRTYARRAELISSQSP